MIQLNMSFGANIIQFCQDSTAVTKLVLKKDKSPSFLLEIEYIPYIYVYLNSRTLEYEN